MRLLLLLSLLLAAQVTAQPARVVVSPADVTLRVDATHTLQATAYDADGHRLAGAEVRWFSPDEAVLTIDADGVATAHSPGTVRVAATVAGVPGYAAVTVRPLPPATIEAALPAAALLAGTGMPLTVTVRDRRGGPLPDAALDYESSDYRIATVNSQGRLFGHRPGRTTIKAMAGPAWTQLEVTVVPNPAASYQITPSQRSVRTGDVVRFALAATTAGGDAVPGLFPAWTLGQAGAQIDTEGPAGVFVAEKPGTYTVTALIGPELTQTATVTVAPRRVEQPLMTVGRGPVGHHRSGDMWVFEGVDGHDYVYVGTFYHDWMKVWDVTDPEAPLLTDSVQVDARRINDVKIHPNGRLGIITREGASSRRNGIVLLNLSDPAHPTLLSEYTDTVTGGVHNVWIRGDEELVYAIHNGTSEMHILDISDPMQVKEVGRWGLDKPNKVLHDVIVQEGYAYLSYWDDGVVTLDVGAGTHGGTPTRPAFVSRLAYPEGNTHVAWRDGRYLFVGDEIYPADWDPNTPAPIEARGFIHVLDMQDPDHPVQVARYEVPEAGAHNVWTDDGKLYIGYYQGGLRVVDITGELRGDLYRQGREIGALKTTDGISFVPNWPMTWGAQVFKGHIFSSDMNSGLWITRLAPPPPVP